jgi:chromosome segregation ATPase
MKRPFRILGLVRGRSYDALAEQHAKAEAHAAKLARHLEESKADSRGWKTKAEEAVAELKKAQEDAATVRKELRQAEKQKELLQERTAELVALKQRLADSERDLIVAREQLMAIEVKLDILEGAANVLDARTRELVTRRSGVGTESGTAV